MRSRRRLQQPHLLKRPLLCSMSPPPLQLSLRHPLTSHRRPSQCPTCPCMPRAAVARVAMASCPTHPLIDIATTTVTTCPAWRFVCYFIMQMVRKTLRNMRACMCVQNLSGASEGDLVPRASENRWTCPWCRHTTSTAFEIRKPVRTPAHHRRAEVAPDVEADDLQVAESLSQETRCPNCKRSLVGQSIFYSYSGLGRAPLLSRSESMDLRTRAEVVPSIMLMFWYPRDGGNRRSSVTAGGENEGGANASSNKKKLYVMGDWCPQLFDWDWDEANWKPEFANMMMEMEEQGFCCVLGHLVYGTEEKLYFCLVAFACNRRRCVHV